MKGRRSRRSRNHRIRRCRRSREAVGDGAFDAGRDRGAERAGQRQRPVAIAAGDDARGQVAIGCTCGLAAQQHRALGGCDVADLVHHLAQTEVCADDLVAGDTQQILLQLPVVLGQPVPQEVEPNRPVEALLRVRMQAAA